ncbi:ORF6N domain-containing protein [Escherichia coli]
MNIVTINNKQFPVIEYRGQRVVTFAIIDDVHQRPEGTARAAFNRNRSHFIEGVDFLEMTADVIRMEMIAAMAADAVRQQKRLSHVEEKIETVTKAVENIKRGTMRTGYVGYRQVVAKSGMSDAKCRNLVNAYHIPTDTHEFMTPDGLLSRRAIVELETFMAAFHQMMSEAEPRGTRWYHPKMGLFQVIGWEDKA